MTLSMTEKPEDSAPSLASMEEKLATLKQAHGASSSNVVEGKRAAYRAATDFASATAVGSLMGFGVDYFGGTTPWGMLVGLVVGVAAGCKMMLKEMNSTPETKA